MIVLLAALTVWDIDIEIALAETMRANSALIVAQEAHSDAAEAAEYLKPTEIQWQSVDDLDGRLSAIQHAAKDLGKPMWIHFGFQSCGPCQKQRKTWDDPIIVELSERYVCVSVDTKLRPDIRAAWNIPEGFPLPLDIVFDPATRRMRHKQGIMTKYNLTEFLKEKE